MELVIFVGLPASGKSTFYRERLASTHAHVSRDAMPRSANKERLVREQVEQALREGHNVAVDNVNATAADRARLIEQGRRYGARVVGYFFDSTPRDCLERNRGRTGAARVPAVAIFASAKRLSAPQPGEGFDALFRVRLRADNGATAVDIEPMAEATSVIPTGG
jgi:predicted kinase